MDAPNFGEKLLTNPASGRLLDIVTRLIFHDRLRKVLLRAIEWWAGAHSGISERVPMTRRMIEHQRKIMTLAILHTVDRILERRILSPQLARVIAELWGRALCLPPGRLSAVQSFREEHGCDPPWFLTISPGHACNLTCEGCYANSPSTRVRVGAAALDWSLLDRIMTEARELWGVPLFVFSGGEPLMYRSEGKDLLDMVERHSDCLFLMFTNGTLIDKETAARLARLGNLTPALSVEGMHEYTDERRGRGVFAQALDAMADLREAGVPFGISVTVTRANCDEILSDQFLDFFFAEQGAFYGFLFQYMPIGQTLDMDLMPTHEQRIKSWRRCWEVVATKRLFLVDFWNHGPLAEGCISAGREGGYIYIDWNGEVMPSVFAPYSAGNIQQIYAHGGTLNSVWETPFFGAIRQWQRDYGYRQPEPSPQGNWLSPCPFRDHYHLFRDWVDRYQPKPEDEAAEEALLDGQYYEEMVAYGQEYRELSQEIWEKEYLGRK
jgi:MoaA/NifB/PqqE/SkfB family radical SAM enzyme